MNTTDLWVFGYGSLVWQPGFKFADKKIARLNGYKRSFCMWSVHYRGTPEHKGLVLALDENAQSYCDGVAFRVDPQEAEESLAYLRARELISSAYLEARVDVEFADGGGVNAVTYVMNCDHDQYAVDLELEDQAKIIANASGSTGSNTEYLYNVAQNLKALDLTDPELEWLCQRVQVLKNEVSK